MTNLTELKSFINEPHVDLGPNAWRLADLVKPMKNARFLDLGVRNGASSALMSIDAKENNNKVCGCDLNFDGFQRTGARFVNDDYMCYLYDSVTLGKYWDEEPFDVIFVDTIHTREFVLAELYFWSDHLKDGGYFVFHDSHWEREGGEIILGVNHRRVDEAITDFFCLPKSVMEMDKYEDDNVILEHYPGSYGMSFVKVKSPDSIEKFKNNVDWEEVFKIRNELNDICLNTKRSDCLGKEWNLDFDSIQNESVITV